MAGGPGGEAEGFVDGLDAFQHFVIVFYDVYNNMICVCLKKIVLLLLKLDACDDELNNKCCSRPLVSRYDYIYVVL